MNTYEKTGKDDFDAHPILTVLILIGIVAFSFSPTGALGDFVQAKSEVAAVAASFSSANNLATSNLNDSELPKPRASAGVLEQTTPGLPVRLTIPSINVDAPIESVGMTPEGDVGAPSGPGEAAWFDLGPRPGEKGSAVIVGHFGWKDGIAAVFDDLSILHPGDKIYVEDESGATTSYVVRELRTYGENEDVSSILASSDGKAHLNLITCEGVWNKTEKSYSNRLVVFADEEETQ